MTALTCGIVPFRAPRPVTLPSLYPGLGEVHVGCYRTVRDEAERAVPRAIGSWARPVGRLRLPGSRVAFYGGLGWLADHYLRTSFLLPVGILLGLALSLYLIFKRYGHHEEPKDGQ